MFGAACSASCALIVSLSNLILFDSSLDIPLYLTQVYITQVATY